MTRRWLLALGGAVLAGVGLSGPTIVGAAGPTIERIAVDEEFEDDLLSEACGVPVTTRLHGFLIIREFDGEGTGPVELTTINVGATSTSGDRTIKFRDVGADLVRVEPDGTLILQIIGQVPGQFAGVLKIDLDTGEAILEPKDRSEWQLERACKGLTG